MIVRIDAHVSLTTRATRNSELTSCTSDRRKVLPLEFKQARLHELNKRGDFKIVEPQQQMKTLNHQFEPTAASVPLAGPSRLRQVAAAQRKR